MQTSACAIQYVYVCYNTVKPQSGAMLVTNHKHHLEEV